MNQIDEQKGLIEYLEAALTAARKHLASDPEKITKLEQELSAARAEFERLSPKPSQSIPTAPTLLNREIPRHAAHQRDFELNLQLHREPFYSTFVNNLKSLFVNETKVYNISARPIQTNLMVEMDPWYRTLGNNRHFSPSGTTTPPSTCQPSPCPESAMISSPCSTSM